MMIRSEDFWRDDLGPVLEHVKRFPDKAIPVLSPLILQGNAVRSDGWCLRHNRRCRIRTATRHIAGTICVGFSQRGTGLATADVTMIPTLCWLAQRRLCQEPEVLQENVRGCPPELFYKHLSDIYHMEVFSVDSVAFGWACGRERQFMKFRHRGKIMSSVSPCSRFMRRFYRACQYSWREHFWVRKGSNAVFPDELRCELEWAYQRPTGGKSGETVNDDDVGKISSFEDSLTETEKSYLFTYRAQYPNQCYQLNQDPDSDMGSCSSEWCLQTIINNCHLLWYDLPDQPRLIRLQLLLMFGVMLLRHEEY